MSNLPSSFYPWFYSSTLGEISQTFNKELGSALEDLLSNNR